MRISATKFLDFLRKNQGILALALTFAAVCVALWTVIISVNQLQRAERAAELNAISTILNVYYSPKANYRSALTTYLDRCELSDELLPSEDHENACEAILVVGSYSLWDYLNAIEAACHIYLNDLVDDERRQFISGFVGQDISRLTFTGYDEQTGMVGPEFSDSDSMSVPWITSDLQPSDQRYLFEATRACLAEWNIVLREFRIM